MTGSGTLPIKGPHEWSHEAVIRGEPPRVAARAFVSQHLVAHNEFHLVDVVQVVACQLAAKAIVRANPPVKLSLSKAGEAVLFSVEFAPSSASVPVLLDHAEEVRSGATFLDHLDLSCGLGCDDQTAGVWVRFDARRQQRHAIHAARPIAKIARFMPGAGGRAIMSSARASRIGVARGGRSKRGR